MKLEDYNAFTKEMVENLKGYDDVLGLVAVGSMAQLDYMPDEYSDHDFFLVVKSGHQGFYRKNFAWLPNAEQIVLSFTETQHGVKVIYKSGHLLEFAVFDEEEVYLAKVNRYRVLLDLSDIEKRMGEVRDQTGNGETIQDMSDEYLVGQFLTNLLVGLGRYWRGEKISAHHFIKSHALNRLVILVEKHLPSERKCLLDNIAHNRRFEFVYPKIGREIEQILLLPADECAYELLHIAEREISKKVDFWPKKMVQILKKY